MKACITGHKEVVKLLLDHYGSKNIDFNARVIHGRTLRRHFGMFVMNGFWFCQNANEAVVKLHSFQMGLETSLFLRVVGLFKMSPV